MHDARSNLADPPPPPNWPRNPPASDPSWSPGGRPILVDAAALENLAWPEFFGAARPVELEIGTGKAAFLLRRARLRPDRSFLGIEWANEFYRYAADRMRRWAVPNVRMLRTDAGVFICKFCPRDSLTALHIYHPDPWPKKRHHKRRIFQPDFVAAAAACLLPPTADQPGGRLAVQTDHAEYFAWICAVLRAQPALAETEFLDPAWAEGFEPAADEPESDGPAAPPSLRLATNFENKYRREGRSIYQIALVRTAPAGAAIAPVKPPEAATPPAEGHPKQ